MALSDRMGTLLSALVRSLFPFGQTLTVVTGPLKGWKYELSPGMGVSYALPFGDPFNFAWFCRHIKKGMTVYDVGANRGQMTLLFSKLTGKSGRVYAFEPLPQAFQSLSANCVLNHLSNAVPHQVAVCASLGQCTLVTFPGRPTQSKIEGVEPSYFYPQAQSIPVEAMTLDSILDRGVVPDLIKIDVEGGGAEVLKGAEKLLKEHSPQIYIELHGPDEQRGVNEFLISNGFTVETLTGQRIADATTQWANPLYCYREPRTEN